MSTIRPVTHLCPLVVETYKSVYMYYTVVRKVFFKKTNKQQQQQINSAFGDLSKTGPKWADLCYHVSAAANLHWSSGPSTQQANPSEIISAFQRPYVIVFQT